MTHLPLPAKARNSSRAIRFVTALLALLLLSTGTALARGSGPVATTASTLPSALRLAASASAQADRRLVTQARILQGCLRAHAPRPGVCAPARSALQRAGSRLAAARRALARIAHAGHAWTAGLHPNRLAPALAVSGTRLSWTRVGRMNTYVVSRRAAGQPTEYSIVAGISTTPAPAPGDNVLYSVRTTAPGSLWARSRMIAYPAPIPVPTPGPGPGPGPGPEVPDTQAAPTISVAGHSLSWNAVGGVNVYVLVAKVPGRADSYSVVAGTTATPAAVPGASVRYSVRTAVLGSAWATEAVITYPVAPPTPEPPVETPPPAPAGFQAGINSGWVYDGQMDIPAVEVLKAKLVRVNFPIEWTAAQLERTIKGYAERGIRVAPLATFDGRMPTPAEARGLASWARAYGAGGTFWNGRADGRLAVQTIEFGNETSGGYQYGDGAGAPSYTERARNYAVRLKEAAEAIAAGGVKVGLLAVAEDWTGDWMNGMFSAVPNLGSYLAGWVSHPYGTDWRSKLQGIITQSAAHGAPASIPIDVTEWGLASDSGRCLSENYGWSPCMSSQQAAEGLRSNVAGMRQMLGSRLAMFMLYQVRDQQVSGASTEREGYFGILQHANQSKGAYTQAAQELLAS